MDFSDPESSDGVPFPKPLILLAFFLEYAVFAISLLLYRLGLCSSPATTPMPYWDDDLFYHFPATNVPPKSTSAESSSIKKQLRVVEFSSLSKRPSQSAEDESATCIICLGQMEAKHKVRELGNCGHGFHLECIDNWVDVGQVTCPLCRAHLLPSLTCAEERRELIG
ncbi:putative E3 ubiquitin-protein ligase RHA1A [Canna indica]|uniref:E3 ubiquitin-protein ligase RHA1A n=1 Tax=Canna indica TaxID=4628 RepID=A0AAQ3JZF2_9LILI|nr:putative E3 ubiquitin-protein ligase RHA1A [Canna indica]